MEEVGRPDVEPVPGVEMLHGASVGRFRSRSQSRRRFNFGISRQTLHACTPAHAATSASLNSRGRLMHTKWSPGIS